MKSEERVSSVGNDVMMTSPLTLTLPEDRLVLLTMLEVTTRSPTPTTAGTGEERQHG